jgi:hypothetical protein
MSIVNQKASEVQYTSISIRSTAGVAPWLSCRAVLDREALATQKRLPHENRPLIRCVRRVGAARFHVAKDRLRAFGCSFASPAAPNTTEDGRTKNRRVELVKWN